MQILDYYYFFCKNCNPPEKSYLLFSSNPLSKFRSCQAPLFENLLGGSTPQQEWGVGGWGFVWGPATLLKKRLWHRRLLVNFMKFLSLFYRIFPGQYIWLWWKTLCWKTKFPGNLGAYCINLINMKCWVKLAVWNPLDWEFILLINRP